MSCGGLHKLKSKGCFVKIELIEVNNILTPASGFIARCGFDFTLNTALGCAFGCSYCYATAFTQKMSSGEEWGKWTKLKSNAGALIRRSPSLVGKEIYMASVTDPYQPSEREHRVSRGVLEALLECHTGFTLVVQTRGPLITRDIDLLVKLQVKNTVRVNFTVSNDSEKIRQLFEPTCPSLGQRLDAVQRLCDAGIQTNITVTPMLPLKDPVNFAALIFESGVREVVVQVFHDDQNGRENIRGTRSEASEKLAGLGLSRRDLVKQSYVFADALRANGIKVGMNEAGFKAP
jgi:DNA repair photolyase